MLNMDTKVPVLYIMGSGRSGSTVMDSVLGNHKDVESVGELMRLPRDGWQLDRICACGESASCCSFWSEVFKKWSQYTGIKDVNDYLRIEAGIRHRCRKVNSFIEPNTSSHDFIFYADATLALFSAIKEVSGKSIIVDSSKDTLRAYLLSFIPGIDLHILHLVRDVRGVVWSYKKSFTKNINKGIEADVKERPVWKTSIDWLRINIQAEWVGRQLARDRYIRIRYEDFATNTEYSLKQIGGLIGVDMSELIDSIRQGKEIMIGHTIAGNRLRMSKSVKLNIDEEWEGGLSTMIKGISWLIAFNQMRSYGYKM